MTTEAKRAARPDSTGRRIAHLPAAVLGNGSLLATLSARGEVERLFWPRVDWAQHLGELRLGVAANRRTRWLDEEPFTHEQRYLDDALVLRTLVRDGELELELVDHVAADAPVLVRHVRAAGEGLRLAVYCRPQLGESSRYGGAWHAGEGCVVFYRRDVALAIVLAASGEAPAGGGLDGGPTAIGGALAAHGPADATLAGDLHDELVVTCAFGTTPEEAMATARRHAARRHADLLGDRLAYDRSRLQAVGGGGSGSDSVEPLLRRSLLVFDAVTDRRTGGVVAAPEPDPDFVHSGGYGFVWARDLAYAALAFAAVGRDRELRAALRWSARTQSADGVWLQRHWTDGLLAPSWTPLQLDETGAVLLAYEAAWRALADEALDRELWPAARRAAGYLLGFRDARTGLPLPSHDLWEESEGRHAYTAASVAGGLRAAAAMAARHEPALAEQYAGAAAEVTTAIERVHWSEGRGHYVSSLEGRALDASLAGLAWPFGVVDPASQRMQATLSALERELAAPCGGIRRYAGDTYAGGNAWVLTTLWLGLARRAGGDLAGHERALRFACEAQTELGLLPEQVADDGSPAWVLPLTWSHAMLVIAARPDVSPLTR
jgi:glucoamylase